MNSETGHDPDCCMEKNTEFVLDRTIGLLQKLNNRDKTYVLALLKSSETIPTETNSDVMVDETVYSIRKLLDTLPARQRIYAMESLSYSMNHYFEKNLNKNEILQIVCEMVTSVLCDMEKNNMEKKKNE